MPAPEASLLQLGQLLSRLSGGGGGGAGGGGGGGGPVLGSGTTATPTTALPEGVQKGISSPQGQGFVAFGGGSPFKVDPTAQRLQNIAAIISALGGFLPGK